MDIRKKYENLRRLAALTLAISTAQAALPVVMPSVQGDKKASKGMESGHNGIPLANITDGNLLSLLMPVAYAESNEDAMVEQIMKIMKEEYGEVIASKDSLRNLFLYLNSRLSNEDDIKEGSKLARVIIGYNSNPATKGFFNLSDIIVDDEYSKSELGEIEGLCRTLKTSTDDKDEENFMSYTQNHNDGVIYLSPAVNKTVTSYEIYFGSMYLELGDSILDQNGQEISWTRYASYNGDKKITYVWSKKRKGYEAYDENDERISGKLYNPEQMIAMVENGKAVKEGILADTEFRYNGLIGNIDEPCKDQSTDEKKHK